MGRDFDAQSAAARLVYDEASEALGLDLRALSFGSDARLALTEFQQPAILTFEIAALRCLEADHGFVATHYGGHSLGEYSALVAAGVIGLSDAVRLVQQRGRLMAATIAPGIGGMTAVTGRRLGADEIETCLHGLCVDIAGVNAPGQIVLSGRKADLGTAEELIGALVPGARLRPLQVLTPFHSRLMAPVEPLFRAVLEAAAEGWDAARAAIVTSNYTGAFHAPERSELVDCLTRQITGRVRWLDNAETLAALGPSRLVEIGPSPALRHAFMTWKIPFSSVTCVGETRALARGLAAA